MGKLVEMVLDAAIRINPKLPIIKLRWNDAESPFHILEIIVHVYREETKIENRVRSLYQDVPLIRCQ